MKINFSKESTQKILQNYYTQTEGMPCQVEMLPIACGRGRKTLTANVSINFYLLGEEIASTKTISQDEIAEVFASLLDEEGYEVSSFTPDIEEIEGAYIWDQGCVSTYFGGVDIEVKQKSFQKQMVKVGR